MTTPPSGPAADQTVDRDLGAVLDEVISAIEGASEEKLFVTLADGLDHRLAHLRER
jgi:hypothetical protein